MKIKLQSHAFDVLVAGAGVLPERPGSLAVARLHHMNGAPTEVLHAQATDDLRGAVQSYVRGGRLTGLLKTQSGPGIALHLCTRETPDIHSARQLAADIGFPADLVSDLRQTALRLARRQDTLARKQRTAEGQLDLAITRLELEMLRARFR